MAWIIALGTAFEYYDFVIYALFIKVLATQFFNTQEMALWLAVGVFAGGYLVRPLGGIIFGICGDKFGRKRVFFTSMLMMAGATTLMGLTPSYQTAGIFATVLFVFARLLQGLSYGAEMPGAMVYLTESTAKTNRGRSFSVMLLGTCAGVALATLVYWAEVALLNNQEIAAWGWRLPFLLGGLLAVVVAVFRRQFTETTAFRRHEHQALRINACQLCLVPICFLLVLFPASYVMFNSLFLPLYIVAKGVPISPAQTALVLFLGNIWCAVLLPVAGKVADVYGAMRVYRFLLAVVLLSAPYLFGMLNGQPSLWQVYAFVFFNQTLLAFFAPTYMSFIPAAFSVRYRFTATALVYNLAYAAASLVPMQTIHSFGTQPGWRQWIIFEVLAFTALVASLTVSKNVNYLHLTPVKK